ncbi:hypothetical protein BJX64DRAFT_117256 [Aspergillus heterothallicus]
MRGREGGGVARGRTQQPTEPTTTRTTIMINNNNELCSDPRHVLGNMTNRAWAHGCEKPAQAASLKGGPGQILRRPSATAGAQRMPAETIQAGLAQGRTRMPLSLVGESRFSEGKRGRPQAPGPVQSKHESTQSHRGCRQSQTELTYPLANPMRNMEKQVLRGPDLIAASTSWQTTPLTGGH